MHCIVVDCLLPEFEEEIFTGYSVDSGNSLESSIRRIDTPQLWCDWGSNEEILKTLLSCITTFSSDSNVKIDAAAGDDDSGVTYDENTRYTMQFLTVVIHSPFPTHHLNVSGLMWQNSCHQ